MKFDFRVGFGIGSRAGRNHTFLLFMIAATYFLLYKSKFLPLGVTNNWYWESNFGDLKRNLKMMSCSLEYQHSIYSVNLPGDCGGFTYGYYPALLLDLIGINESFSTVLGVTFFLALVFSILLFSRILLVEWNIPFLLIYLLLVSPGFWLAIVHGSLDIPVFILIIVSRYFARFKYSNLTFLLILFTVLFKFFTLPLLFLLVIRAYLQRETKSQAAIHLMLTTFASFSIIQVMRLIDYEDSSYRMAQGVFHTFGVESLPIWMEVLTAKYGLASFSLSSFERKLLGVLFLIALACFLNFKNPFVLESPIRVSELENIHLHSRNQIIQNLTFFGLPYLTLFIQGQNYDNKLIFLSIPCFALYTLIKIDWHRKVFLVIAISTFWFTCFYPYYFPHSLFVLIEITGDICAFIITSLLLVAFWNFRAYILLQSR